MNIGILALQGNFDSHRQRLSDLGARTLLVRKTKELESIEALVIPGGESSTLLKLLDASSRNELIRFIHGGIPVLATCAGIILLAKEVFNPTQESLGVLDVSVARNAYGRQVDSFIEPNLSWTKSGKDLWTSTMHTATPAKNEGVFIRAPRITRISNAVETILERNGEPVFVRSGNIFGATFHPELSSSASNGIHELFLKTLRAKV